MTTSKSLFSTESVLESLLNSVLDSIPDALLDSSLAIGRDEFGPFFSGPGQTWAKMDRPGPWQANLKNDLL